MEMEVFTERVTGMPKCLFCQDTDQTHFSKVEHIVPESLGNRQYVLPAGIVCDKCNGFFSKLENYFCHHHLASGHKLLKKYRTKKGKPPSMPLQAGEMRQDETGRVHFRQALIEGKEREQLAISFFERDVAIRVCWPLPDTDSRKISRFLTKAGIETLYFKLGAMALEPAFDFVRKYARFGSKLDFVPFLWCYHPQQSIDLFIGTFDFKKNGRFHFGTVFLPGIVYLVPLDRVEEEFAVEAIRGSLKFAGNSLNLCKHACTIKREPIELVAHLSADSGPQKTRK